MSICGLCTRPHAHPRGAGAGECWAWWSKEGERECREVATARAQEQKKERERVALIVKTAIEDRTTMAVASEVLKDYTAAMRQRDFAHSLSRILAAIEQKPGAPF